MKAEAKIYSQLVEKAFLEKEEALKDVCSVKIVRGFDPTERYGAYVQVWDSNNHDRIIRASNNHALSFYEDQFFHLDTGRAVTLEELPDRQWFGVQPVIILRRFNGFMDKVDPPLKAFLKEYGLNEQTELSELTKEYAKKYIEFLKEHEDDYADYECTDPYHFAKPVSEEFAVRYKETPEYVADAEKKIGVEVSIDVCDNIFTRDDHTGLNHDKLSIYEKLENISTAQLAGFMTELGNLIGNIDKDNDAAFEELGVSIVSEHRIFMMFYTKDFDILEVYYDYDDKKLKYDLYEYGSNKNGIIEF